MDYSFDQSRLSRIMSVDEKLRLKGFLAAESNQRMSLQLQCYEIVMVRDDFWMPATRFFRDLDIPLGFEGEQPGFLCSEKPNDPPDRIVESIADLTHSEIMKDFFAVSRLSRIRNVETTPVTNQTKPKRNLRDMTSA